MNTKIIVSEEDFLEFFSEINKEEEDDYQYMTPTHVYHQFSTLQTLPQNISLLHTCLTDTVFAELTQKILPIFPVCSVTVLDLSFNNLTPKCVSFICDWITKHENIIINLYGNHKCCNTNIGLFSKTMKEYTINDNKPLESMMRHIIFLPNYYIHHAKTKVKYYHQMQEKGYLPVDWANIHQKFYNNPIEQCLVYDPDINRVFDEYLF